jgi:hypothetical protein
VVKDKRSDGGEKGEDDGEKKRCGGSCSNIV